MNNEEKEYIKLTPFKMQVLQSFPFIDADFDALTNYELLCKVVDYLNKTLDNVDALHDEIEEYINKFNELKAYVDNYFDNLDVQEEINNKLDEMAESGELTNLIKDYVDPIYEAYEDEINDEISDFKTLINGQVQQIDEKVTSATSGSPSGVYNTVSDLTSDNPDHSKIYVVLADGKWYYYDTTNTSWTAGGVYLSETITNLFTELLFTGSQYTFHINTTNNTITIGICRFIFKQTYYNVSSNQTISIPTTGSRSCYLYYDTTDSTFKINPLDTAPLDTYAIVALFDRETLTPLRNTFKIRYTVDDTVYNDKIVNNIIPFVSLSTEDVFEFDTVNNIFKLNSAIRFYNLRTGAYVTVQPTTVDYSSQTETTLCIAYNFSNSSLEIKKANSCVNNENYGIFVLFNKNFVGGKEGISYKGNIKINGINSQNYAEKLTLYVDSENGNDTTGNGSSTNPFKTLNKALPYKPTTLCVLPGEYMCKSKVINWDINIKGIFDTYDGTTNPKYKKPVFYGGDKLEPVLDNVTNLLKVAYSSTNTSNIYKVFVSQTLPIDTGGNRPTYTVILWVSDIDNEINDIKLLPVLSLELCQSTQNSFYYDGTDIYINDNTNFEHKRYILSVNDIASNVMTINNSNAVINNIAFRYGYQRCCNIHESANAVLNNCDFGNAGSYDGISLDDSNSYLYNCNAYQNRNDGFNIHSFGVSHFYNCNGYYNGDDGISHHNGTTGYIEGGEWYHNGKGGISSPTYNSHINVSGAYCHDNVDGILAFADNLVPGNILISNCLLKNNTYDINNRNYTIIGFNNKYDTTNIEGSGTITAY